MALIVLFDFPNEKPKPNYLNSNELRIWAVEKVSSLDGNISMFVTLIYIGNRDIQYTLKC